MRRLKEVGFTVDAATRPVRDIDAMDIFQQEESRYENALNSSVNDGDD